MRKLALQLADSRTPGEVPRLLARPIPGVGLRVVEWRGTLGHYAAAAALAGATARMVGAPGGPDARAVCWPLGVAEAGTRGHDDIVFASLTEDNGEEARRWAHFIIGAEAAMALADAPRASQLRPARIALEEAGYSWELYDLNAAEWGGEHGEEKERRAGLQAGRAIRHPSGTPPHAAGRSRGRKGHPQAKGAIDDGA